MAERMVRSADSEVPDLGNGLWERVRDAVSAESGSRTSLWNGTLNYTTEETYRGAAYPNGKVELNRELVVEPLQQMYATRGQPATEQQWIERRNALKTVAHEFNHLAGPEGFTHARWNADLGPMEFRPLEEGVTEAWSQGQLDQIADRVLPPDLAAQVKAVRGPHSYPAYEPAARAFADQVGAEANLSGNEVLSRMAGQPPRSKARAAADVLFDHSDLPKLVPADQEEAVRQQLATQIDRGFADLQSMSTSTAPNLRSISRTRGLEIADAASDTVRSTENHYRALLEQQQTQQLQTTRQQSATREQPTLQLPRLQQPGQQAAPQHPGQQAVPQQQPGQQRQFPILQPQQAPTQPLRPAQPHHAAPAGPAAAVATSPQASAAPATPAPATTTGAGPVPATAAGAWAVSATATAVRLAAAHAGSAASAVPASAAATTGAGPVPATAAGAWAVSATATALGLAAAHAGSAASAVPASAAATTGAGPVRATAADAWAVSATATAVRLAAAHAGFAAAASPAVLAASASAATAGATASAAAAVAAAAWAVPASAGRNAAASAAA